MKKKLKGLGDTFLVFHDYLITEHFGFDFKVFGKILNFDNGCSSFSSFWRHVS